LQAQADFTRAIDLRPDDPELLIQRAPAEQGLQQYRESIRDLNRALLLGGEPTRVYFMRAEARRRSGDAAGAADDRAAGLRRQPMDAKGWLALGYARMAGEPRQALEDFNKALRLDPRSLPGLQNKASVLGRLGRNQEGVETLNRAVQLHPDYPLARAVYLARLGRRQEAYRDAEECLRRDKQQLVAYQIAGVYSLTSRQHPADRQRALQLLAQALQQGCGFDFLDQDRDLNPIRNDREFQELSTASRKIRAPAMKKP
jgi:tetratricopeptide (TPR) repeat protein